MSDPHTNNHRALRATPADIEHFLRSADTLHLSEAACEKLRWFLHAMRNGGNVRKTCEHFSIAPSTFNRWAIRFDPADPMSLEERSKRPIRMRKSTVPPAIIEQIRKYRLDDPHISRDAIRAKLIAEHSITLSASSIGRVIRRHNFFFAQTSAHWLKRAGESTIAALEQGIVDRMVEERIRTMQDGFGSSAAAFDVEQNSTIKKQKYRGCADGHLLLSIFIVSASLVAAGIFLGSEKANALAGNSYQLFEDFAGETSAGTVAGSNFQIATALPAANSSSSTSSSTSSSSSSATRAGFGGSSTPRVAPPKQKSIRPSPINKKKATSVMRSPTKSNSQAHSAAPSATPKTRVNPKFRFPSQGVVPTIRLLPRKSKAFDAMDTPGFLLLDVPTKKAPQFSSLPLSNSTGESMFFLLAGALGGLFLPFRKHRIFLSMDMPLVRLSAGPYASERRRLHKSVRYGIDIFLPMIGITKIAGKENCGAFNKNPIYRHSSRMSTRMRKGIRLDFFVIIAVLVGFFLFWGTSKAFAATSTPLTRTYNGQLLDSTGNAVTTAITIRFSYWKNADFVPTDLTSTGAINTSATHYVNWTEEHTITPKSNGYISLQLGSSKAFPPIDATSLDTLLNLYLQIEVKTAGAADSAYDFLDANAGSSTLDRSPILSVTFALNADLLDLRDVGSASGDLAILGPGGMFRPAQIGGGTDSASFIIDDDASEADVISLTFGKNLEKKLSYEIGAGRFVFNDDLHVVNKITASGGIVADGASRFKDSLSIDGLLSGAKLHISGAASFSGGTKTTGTAIFSGAENAERIRLEDKTNNTSIGFYSGNGPPEGVITAQLGSLYFDHATGQVYRKNSALGSTDWLAFSTASGSLHMAKMSRNAVQSIASDALTKIAFDTEMFDIGSIADSVTNDRFTIAHDGKYLISASWRTPSVIDVGEEVAVHIYRNGQSVKQSNLFGVLALNASYEVSVTDVLDLNAGDTIEMYVYQKELASLNTLSDDPGEPRMSVVQLDGGLQNGNAERTVERTYHAGFEGASYQGDASDNVGQLHVDHDNANDRNYYLWSSSLASLQDYDIILLVTLPTDFVRWKDNQLKLTYRSTSADANDNQLDIAVFDTNGSPVSLSGSSLSAGQNLVGTSWATEQIEWTGTPTWTAGQDFLIKLKVQAKNDKQMHVGDLIWQYTELPSE